MLFFFVIFVENMFEKLMSFSFSFKTDLRFVWCSDINLLLGSLSLIKWKSFFFGAYILAISFNFLF